MALLPAATLHDFEYLSQSHDWRPEQPNLLQHLVYDYYFQVYILHLRVYMQEEQVVQSLQEWTFSHHVHPSSNLRYQSFYLDRSCNLNLQFSYPQLSNLVDL